MITVHSQAYEHTYLETRGGLYCLCELDHTSMDALSHLHIALLAWTAKHTRNELLDQSEAREHTPMWHMVAHAVASTAPDRDPCSVGVQYSPPVVKKA
jgi:hypothetical protein